MTTEEEAMDHHLTEISNSYLFSEYLLCLGISVPKMRENWEFTHKDKVVARVRIGHEGQARSYIAAAEMCNRS